MSLQIEEFSQASLIDARAPALLARSTYRDLRAVGLSDTDVMAFAGELLALVAAGVRSSREADGRGRGGVGVGVVPVD